MSKHVMCHMQACLNLWEPISCCSCSNANPGVACSHAKEHHAQLSCQQGKNWLRVWEKHAPFVRKKRLRVWKKQAPFLGQTGSVLGENLVRSLGKTGFVCGKKTSPCLGKNRLRFGTNWLRFGTNWLRFGEKLARFEGKICSVFGLVWDKAQVSLRF